MKRFLLSFFHFCIDQQSKVLSILLEGTIFYLINGSVSGSICGEEDVSPVLKPEYNLQSCKFFPLFFCSRVAIGLVETA